MSETMIAVDGGKVWADDNGVGEGPPLVLLHPGVGDSRVWDPILPALAASHRVIRYDARGYGRSPAPTVTFSLLADLIAVLDHFGIGSVVIVGCSQGGNSGLGLAIGQPQRVAALEQAAARIPDCELIEVAGVDHLPPLRVPDLVLQTIASTLARVPH